MAVQTQTYSFDNTQVAFKLKSDKELKKAFWLFRFININFLVTVGPKLLKAAQWMHLPINGIVKATVFDYFCGGETLEETIPEVQRMASANVLTVLDYGVEGLQSEYGYDETARKLMQTLDFAAEHEYVPVVSLKITGMARLELLEKLHAGESLTFEEQQEWLRLQDRFYKVCAHAASKDVGLYIDSEETWIQKPLDEMVEEAMKRHNTEKVIIYNTHQMYRTDRLNFIKESYRKSIEDGYFLGAKLVRGAYMEKERERAEKMGYPSPIFDTKAGTDKAFDEGTTFCIEHAERISVCIATHNEASSRLGTELIDKYDLDKQHPHIIFCQLFGMSDHITYNLAEAGYRSSKYLPYGPVKDVMPYLIRRAEENTSIAGQSGRELQLLKKEMKRRGLK